MIDIERLKKSITEQKTRLKILKAELNEIENFKCLSFDLKNECKAYYKNEIDACEINICGAEDYFYDLTQEAMDVLAEMKGAETDD